jgi:hypothetical protein
MKSASATGPSRQQTTQPNTRSVPPTEVRPADKPTEATPQSPVPTSRQVSEATFTADDEQIRRRAYELYLEDGCHDGNHEKHWFAAQRELSGESK